MRKRAFALSALLLALSSCGTRASPPGDRNSVRPNALTGPFRELRETELLETAGAAPYPLTSVARLFREPSVLDLARTGEPGTAALYAMATIAGVTGIYRFVAPDARSFYPDPDPSEPVLQPELPWEGGGISSPSVHRVGNEVWLFYTGDAGIGLARSRDGVEFERQPTPVLEADEASDWERGLPPGSPALLRVSENDWRLFYSVRGCIGEAQSEGTARFVRATGDPVLAPNPTDAAAFDAASVGEPHAMLATTAEGRVVTRVYYAAVDRAGKRAIGLAARFGTAGPLERAAMPVLTTTRNPRSPWVVRFNELALLFVTQQAGVTDALDYPAIAVAVAPPTASLSLR
jgi:hypothetical protein